MATLGKIRNHGVLLIVIVGLAMFAFIIGDFLSSGTSYFNRRREYIGEVEGQKIHYTEYEAAKDRLTEVYKIETGRNDIDEDMSAELRQEVWRMFLTDYTLQAEGKKIGMTITAKELADQCFGENVHNIISSRRAFYDETGQFNRQQLMQFVSHLDDEAESADQQAYLNQARTYWFYWQDIVRITRMQEKYTSLFSSCLTANSLDAKHAFDEAQQSVDVEYVSKPYFAIADSLVTVKNSDIKALYDKKKSQYKQMPNRTIAYVAFPIVPLREDYEETELLMKRLQDEFYTTDDVMTVVNVNSDVTYSGRNLSIDEVPEQYKEFAFGKDAKAGNVTDITFADNTYSMARLVEAGYSLPDSVELRGIAPEEGGEDREIGWVREQDMPKDLADKAFLAKKGERVTVTIGGVEQTFEVLNISKATPKVKLAILARDVTASSKTYAKLYNEAKQFIVSCPSESVFRDSADAQNRDVLTATNLLKTTDKVQDLKSSRPIVRWAFEAKEGDVSDVFECGDRFIVATLAEVFDGEYRPLESVASELRYEVMNDKKAEMLKQQLAGVTSLEEAAKELDAEVRTAEGVSLASYRFGSAGVEPAAIGEALRLESGEVAAVKGSSGVFVIQGGEKKTANGEFNKELQIANLNSRFAYSLKYQIMQMLDDNADVVDNRANFQ